jgi:hypothetical protein
MLNWRYLVILLIFFSAGCSTCKGVVKKSGNNQDAPPVILDSYAAEKIRPGASWRVYLEAQDEDGDIDYIAAQLFQPGVGYYPTSFTYIKGADREGFAGYIYLNTPADYLLLADNFRLDLVLRDCEENRSETVSLPLRFDNLPSYQPQEVPEKWQSAANNELGAIMVDIMSSERYNSNDGNNGRLLR